MYTGQSTRGYCKLTPCIRDRFISSTCLDGIRYDFTENITEKLAHAHAVDTGPFSPCREGPGDEATDYYKAIPN